MKERLINEEKIDLTQKKTFFDPYPNFIGAVIPLPEAIKTVSDALDGQTMLLLEAIQKIKAAMGELPAKLLLLNGGMAYGEGMLCLRLGKNETVTFNFRLIRFRSP